MTTSAEELKQRQARAAARPEIQVVAGNLPGVVDLAEDALLARPPEIYQRGGVLVRPIRTGPPGVDDAIRREADALTLHMVTLPELAEAFDLAALFTRYDGRIKMLKAIDCPKAVAATYQARAGRWRLPALKAIIEAPTLRQDGTVLDQPGYDPASGLLFDPGGTTFPAIPERPTRVDAQAALACLVEPLKGFPFVSDADRSVVLSAILTALVRATLRSAPLFAFTAPTMGSGKSLLADLVSRIAVGRDAAAMSQSRSAEEDAKVLLALLLAGDPLVLIDNVERPLHGDALCSILTQTTYKGRILGSNETAVVPTTTVFIATGNNLQLRGDLTSRALMAVIDPRMERPEERHFEIDPRAYVAEHRGELVAAALTILRGYVVAGRPEMAIKPFGRFEQWSATVRAALVWLGEPDPLTTRERIVADDPLRAELAIRAHRMARRTGRRQDHRRRVAQADCRPRRRSHQITQRCHLCSRAGHHHPKARHVVRPLARPHTGQFADRKSGYTPRCSSLAVRRRG